MDSTFKRWTLQYKLAAIFLLTTPAQAAGVNCYAVSVTDVAVDNNGTLWVTTSTVPLNAICNITAKGAFTLDVNSCNAAFAIFVSAKTSYRSVSVQYATGTCSAPGPYSAYYVQLN